MFCKPAYSKFLFVVVAMLTLSACASTPEVNKPSELSGSQLVIDTVNVTLSQKREVEGFPDEAGVTDIFSKALTEQLNQKNRQSPNKIEVDFTIDYYRTFGWQDLGAATSVTHPIFSYVIIFKNNNKQIYQVSAYQQTVSKGILGNLKVFGKMFSGADPADEIENINIIAKGLVDKALEQVQ